MDTYTQVSCAGEGKSQILTHHVPRRQADISERTADSHIVFLTLGDSSSIITIRIHDYDHVVSVPEELFNETSKKIIICRYLTDKVLRTSTCSPVGPQSGPPVLAQLSTFVLLLLLLDRGTATTPWAHHGFSNKDFGVQGIWSIHHSIHKFWAIYEINP